jgi:hypothetical protein
LTPGEQRIVSSSQLGELKHELQAEGDSESEEEEEPHNFMALMG